MPITGQVANTRGIGWAELGLPDYPGKSVVGLLWRGLMFRHAVLRQGPVHHLAVHGSGDVYFAEGSRLFRLTR